MKRPRLFPSHLLTATYFNSSFTSLNQAYIRQIEKEQEKEGGRDKESEERVRKQERQRDWQQAQRKIHTTLLLGI